MRPSFGSSQLIKCLLFLGFSRQRLVGSSHQKYRCPKEVEVGIRPFITVICGRKSFDPHTANRYISEIRKLGYSKEEIERGLGK